MNAREAAGRQVMGVLGIDPDAVIASVAELDERFGHTIVEYAFGEVVGRPELDLRTRQLVTLALLAAQGGCEPQLDTHIPATLRAGATRDEIVALFVHLTPYAGIPRTMNALYRAKRLFAEADGAIPEQERNS